MMYILRVDIATMSQYDSSFMLKSRKLRDVGSPFLIFLQRAQGKVQAGVVTQHISFHQPGDKLWSYIGVYYTEGVRLRYGDQWLSIA
jgi:hypothetical protein